MDPYYVADAVLVSGTLAIAAAVIWWERRKRARRATEAREAFARNLIQSFPTDQTTPRSLVVRGPGDLTRILADPTIPPVVKVLIANAAHAHGLCGCDGEPYDQDSALTGSDLTWLASQKGRQS